MCEITRFPTKTVFSAIRSMAVALVVVCATSPCLSQNPSVAVQRVALPEGKPNIVVICGRRSLVIIDVVPAIVQCPLQRPYFLSHNTPQVGCSNTS